MSMSRLEIQALSWLPAGQREAILQMSRDEMVRLPIKLSYQGEDLWLLGMDAVLQPDLATLYVLWQGEEYLLYPAWKESKHILCQAMALWDMLKVKREGQ